MSGNSSPSHSSDTSLSLSSALLPEKNLVNNQERSEHHSSISEHIASLNSLENDRSLLEIEISNIPIPDDDNKTELFNASPPLSICESNLSNSARKNVKSVLEEILHNEQFISERSDHLDSNDDTSLNIFDGVNLDDSSINNYVLKLKSQDCDVFSHQEDTRVRSLEDALSVKDSIIQALNVEVESLKDIASNPSTLSMNTTLTEYKMFQEECATKFVNFENAIAHRDSIIAKLKDALIEAQKEEEEMRAECEQYSKDIQCVQKELAEAVQYIKNFQCKCLDKTRGEAVGDGGKAASMRCSDNISLDLDDMYTEMKEHLGTTNEGLVERVQRKIRDFIALKQSVHVNEIGRMQEKHVKEMDETRKFYEEKCADLISNELVSPQSRKLTDVNLLSEEEISDLFVTEYIPKSHTSNEDLTPERVHAFKHKIDTASRVLDKYDMENLGEDALNSLKTTVESFKFLSVGAQDVEAYYQGQIASLRDELHVLQLAKELKDTGTQVNTFEHEIDSIVESYQVRLAEQVELAKVDIMLALEENISKLSLSDCDVRDWPKEFNEIRNKLRMNHEKEVQRVKTRCNRDIQRMNGKINEYKEKIKKMEQREQDASAANKVVKETETTLRKLLIDCYIYFAQCEDELNTTLFDELAKNATLDSDSDNINTVSSSSKSESFAAKHVHLTPNIYEYIKKIDNECANVSIEFKHELGECLARLKQEANAILVLAGRSENAGLAQAPPNNDERPLASQLAYEAQRNQDLTEELFGVKELVKRLEAERNQQGQNIDTLLSRNVMLEGDLAKAKDKIGELVEYGRKEIVSEGYGEKVFHGNTSRVPLAELNNRARQIIDENKGDERSLHVIEELTRECEQLIEDAKRERQDFTLQIESADKKLKSTQQFLEEQATEREQERDEAAKAIAALREELKERQRDRAGYERVNEVALEDDGTGAGDTCRQCVQIGKTVEGFEQQLHEMAQLIADGEKRFVDVNTEREEAIEKIGLLRDIIKDLEKQIKNKEDLEKEFKFLFEKQREANEDLVQQLEAASNTSNFEQHIIHLEEEVNKLRRASDIVGNEGLIKQIQLQLHDLELLVDKNIREIESLYATRSTTTCSTPSEEMSVQDQIRPKTPNSTVDDCEVPLQQLSRLKEKLLKHSRAENSAIKRIQDMELQLLRVKQEHDELLNEKQVLQEQASEQLVLISSLQMRLDDQRIRAECVQKQANASLEMKIYDLENDIQALRDKLQSREATIKQLNKILDETKQRLKHCEEELSSTMVESEICDLKAEIERVKADNELLKIKIENDAQNAQILPSLVDNIIADKNKDLDSLRLKLLDTERQFEMFRSLSAADKSDDMSRGGLSYFNLSSPERMRNAASISLLNVTKFVPEISSIEKVGPPNVNYTTDATLMKPNSTEIHKTTEKHVHFEQDSQLADLPARCAGCAEIEAFKGELQELKDSLHAADNTISDLRVDLAAAKVHLTERETQLNDLYEDSKRKDEMYMKLAKDKRDIEKQFENLDAIRSSIEDLQRNEQHLKELLDDTRGKYKEKECDFMKLQGEYAKFKVSKEEECVNVIEANKIQYEALSKDFRTLSEDYQASQEKFKQDRAELQRLLQDRECQLEILKEDVSRYQNDIRTFEHNEKLNKENQIDKLQNVMHKKEIAEKELVIVKLKSTIENLKRETGDILDQLIAKEEIIETMKTDSEALRVNLETIKSKMNETGNIYDLRQKLVREREINAQLHAENEASIDDVADQVRQQLNDSAQLDDKIFIALSSGDFNTGSDVDVLENTLISERKDKASLEGKIKDLLTKLAESSETIKLLQDALDDQRKLFDHVQVEDTNMMSQIRSKLEEAIENELEYETQLTKEKTLRAQLENEVMLFRMNSNSVGTNSTTEYRSLGNIQEQRLQREVKQLREEVSNLKREIKNLKKTRNATECELKYNKEMLQLKSGEVSKLEKRITVREIEVRKVQDELRQNQQELKMKSWEVENGKSLISSLEQEKIQLNMQISLLEMKQPVQSTSTVSNVFLQKMKDLGDLVTEHINENKLMSATITKLISERNHLEEKIQALEERNRGHMPFDDPVARANHLFGKYLRADSYRHALAFQKKYLIGLLSTYQLDLGAPLCKYEPKRRHAKTPRVNRFRAIAVVIIAINRMKYMVQRWHSGLRSGAYMSLQRKFRGENFGAHFQVGKPVSGEHFRIVSRQNHNAVGVHAEHISHLNDGASTSGIPWSGMSPPSKDAAKITKELFEYLKAPKVELDSYFERFNLIQKRLNTTLNNFES